MVKLFGTVAIQNETEPKSDTIKRWNGHYDQGKSLEGDEKDHAMFKQVEFTHALILKVNQLSKQVNPFKCTGSQTRGGDP